MGMPSSSSSSIPLSASPLDVSVSLALQLRPSVMSATDSSLFLPSATTCQRTSAASWKHTHTQTSHTHTHLPCNSHPANQPLAAVGGVIKGWLKPNQPN